MDYISSRNEPVGNFFVAQTNEISRACERFLHSVKPCHAMHWHMETLSWYGITEYGARIEAGVRRQRYKTSISSVVAGDSIYSQ